MDLPFESQLRSNPADLEANLVYADYLEEQGDPSADIYRWIGQGARWWTGRARGGSVEAMRSGHQTDFLLMLGYHGVASIEAEQTLWRFAVWCARTMVDAQAEMIASRGEPAAEPEKVNPDLLEILEANEAWLDGRRSKMVQVPDSLRHAAGWVNRVCRMAGYGVALSAAKYTSRFAERSGVPALGFESQTFELTRMLAQSWR